MINLIFSWNTRFKIRPFALWPTMFQLQSWPTEIKESHKTKTHKNNTTTSDTTNNL